MSEEFAYYTPKPNGNEAERLFAEGCRSADVDLIKLGLRQGASVHFRDENKSTAIHMLAECVDFDKAKVQTAYALLIERGAPLGTVDDFDEIPLVSAAKRGSPLAEPIFDDMLKQGMAHRLNYRDQTQMTALDAVVSLGNAPLVQRMLEAGADPKLPPSDRKQGVRSALDHAQFSDGDPAVLSRLLIAYGADPADARTNDRYLTPLVAAVVSSKRLNELLVETKQSGQEIPYKEISAEASKMGMKDAEVLLEGFKSLQKALSDIGAMNKPKYRP